MKPELHVSCAIIVNDLGEILAVQRSEEMSMPLKWEFPGGKIEKGESAEEALFREIQEELGITIEILNSLDLHTHSYDKFNITLYPFFARIKAGTISLVEHKKMRWMHKKELLSLEWAEADIPIVLEILEKL